MTLYRQLSNAHLHAKYQGETLQPESIQAIVGRHQNPLLPAAIDGTKPLTDTYKELEPRIPSGEVPTGKDSVYNASIDSLADLSPTARMLRRDGRTSIFNTTTLGVLTLSLGGASLGAYEVMEHMQSMPNDYGDAGVIGMAVVTGAAMYAAAFTGILTLGSSGAMERSKEETLQELSFIDSKLAEIR